MRFHTPVTHNVRSNVPAFTVRNGELVRPRKVFPAEQYPGFKEDMVKIPSQDGRMILIPASKLSSKNI